MTAGKAPATSSSTQAYGEAWYWNNRYTQDPSTFDWYQKYPSLAPLIRLYIPSLHPILVVGCGNSAFSEGMIDDGYNEVINVDISSVVIEAMQKKNSSRPQLKCISQLAVKVGLFVKVLSIFYVVWTMDTTDDMIMDVRDMSAFGTGSFAAVIDKGTLDSLLCGHNSRQNAAKMLAEVWRVLKDKGVYILVTYGSPVYRLPILKELTWTIKLHVIGKIQLGNSSNMPQELTTPVPLDANGGPPESILGTNADVHYIYACIKDGCEKSEA